ncbi:hypothetical protein MKW94_002195, partial [Papaver nudicaule]|nr:hypothetical protein [Papaver nudicaule]
IQVEPIYKHSIYKHDTENERDEENPLGDSRCTKGVKGLIGSSGKGIKQITTHLASMFLMPCLNR